MSLHGVFHSDEEDYTVHCKLCDAVITNNFTPLQVIDTQDFEIELVEYKIQNEIKTFYSFLISNTIASNQLFSRPPPSV